MCDNTHKMALEPALHGDSQHIVSQKQSSMTTHAIFLELFGCDDSLDFEKHDIISEDDAGRLK